MLDFTVERRIYKTDLVIIQNFFTIICRVNQYKYRALALLLFHHFMRISYLLVSSSLSLIYLWLVRLLFRGGGDINWEYVVGWIWCDTECVNRVATIGCRVKYNFSFFVLFFFLFFCFSLFLFLFFVGWLLLLSLIFCFMAFIRKPKLSVDDICGVPLGDGVICQR